MLAETWDYALLQTLFGSREILHKRTGTKAHLKKELAELYDASLTMFLGKVSKSETEMLTFIHLSLDRIGWAAIKPNRKDNQDFLRGGAARWTAYATPVVQHVAKKIERAAQEGSLSTPVDERPSLFASENFGYDHVWGSDEHMVYDGRSKTGYVVSPTDAAHLAETVAEIEKLPHTSSWHRSRAEFTAYEWFCQGISGNRELLELLRSKTSVELALIYLADALDRAV